MCSWTFFHIFKIERSISCLKAEYKSDSSAAQHRYDDVDVVKDSVYSLLFALNPIKHIKSTWISSRSSRAMLTMSEPWRGGNHAAPLDVFRLGVKQKKKEKEKTWQSMCAWLNYSKHERSMQFSRMRKEAICADNTAALTLWMRVTAENIFWLFLRRIRDLNQLQITNR